MYNQTITYKNKTYNIRHGGPFDRGSADSYYNRSPNPHYFEGATYYTDEIAIEPGTPEWDEYMAGYEYNEEFGNKKDWE
jgi:hypothetical protein